MSKNEDFIEFGLPKRIAPDEEGRYGEFGGRIGDPKLAKILKDVEDAFHDAVKDPKFMGELKRLCVDYVGRPSPITRCAKLSSNGGAQIFLKREDLNHTGAHKINHCLGEVLLAKRMGKKKVIAETGAGSHGVALATAAALLDMPCDIYMGEVDIEKQRPNVVRMQMLGTRVVPVHAGQSTLKEAVDAAFEAFLRDPEDVLYCIGSAVGPAPFPEIVSFFQSVVGHEARKQFAAQYGGVPDEVVACVGGGSNSIGIFSGFLDSEGCKLVGVEPGGEGVDHPGRHAASLSKGVKGEIHGFRCYVLQKANGEVDEVYSVASGLDYPGVGPQHCNLRDKGWAQYVTVDDEECLDAFLRLAREEGVIPALESAHAVAYALRAAKGKLADYRILVNLSGRGDKDIDFVSAKKKLFTSPI